MRLKHIVEKYIPIRVRNDNDKVYIMDMLRKFGHPLCAKHFIRLEKYPAGVSLYTLPSSKILRGMYIANLGENTLEDGAKVCLPHSVTHYDDMCDYNPCFPWSDFSDF